MSRAALLKAVAGVARGATRVKTVFQISSSGVCLMQCSQQFNSGNLKVQIELN